MKKACPKVAATLQHQPSAAAASRWRPLRERKIENSNPIEIETTASQMQNQTSYFFYYYHLFKGPRLYFYNIHQIPVYFMFGTRKSRKGSSLSNNQPKKALKLQLATAGSDWDPAAAAAAASDAGRAVEDGGN